MNDFESVRQKKMECKYHVVLSIVSEEGTEWAAPKGVGCGPEGAGVTKGGQGSRGARDGATLSG